MNSLTVYITTDTGGRVILGDNKEKWEQIHGITKVRKNRTKEYQKLDKI